MTVKYLKKAIKNPSTDDTKTRTTVQNILNDIEKRREEGIKEITKKFDKYEGEIIVSKEKIEEAIKKVDQKTKDDVQFAHERIKRFAEHQLKSMNNDFEVELLKRGLAGTAIKMEHFTNHEMYSDFDVALAGLSFRGGGKSTDEKFAKQWSEETEDDIMIYDEWKATYELEDRGWDIIKTEFIFMDGLKLDHDG